MAAMSGELKNCMFSKGEKLTESKISMQLII